jgi:hypothetical protein
MKITGLKIKYYFLLVCFVFATTTGEKLRFPTFETARLGEITKAPESRALQTLDGVKKAISLPKFEKLSFRIDPGEIKPHFLTGHKTGGSRLVQSIKDGGLKGVFPEWMNDKQITNAIKEAYKNSKKVKTQIINGEKKVKLIGQSGDLTIQMWVNLTTKTLESAYTKGGIK